MLPISTSSLSTLTARCMSRRWNPSAKPRSTASGSVLRPGSRELSTSPAQPCLPLFMARAALLGRYPISRAASTTRVRRSSLTRVLLDPPLRTVLTVERATFNRRAISFVVARRGDGSGVGGAVAIT